MRCGKQAGWIGLGVALAAQVVAQQVVRPAGVQALPAAAAQYIDPNLDLVLTYPAALLPRVPETLRVVWQREHMEAMGSAEFDPPDYRVVLHCMNTLFDATGERRPVRNEQGEYAPDTLLVLDVDRGCVDGQVKGDRALAVLAEVALRTHHMTPLIAPVMMRDGKRRMHSGLSSGMMIVNDAVSGAAGAEVGRQSPVYVAAASFEQAQHWILVVYINGTSGEQSPALGKTTVSFHGEPPVLLFPFLRGALTAKR